MARNAVTIRDVAREARVSVATVSRVLNGHDNVAEGVRRQVLEVVGRLRYQPHAAARSLSSRSTQTVGVVLPDLHGEFFSELIRGIDATARARGRHLLLSSYHGDPDEQGAALRAMRGRVDGVLLLSPYAHRPDFLDDNLPVSLPVVLINTHALSGRYPVLNVDNRAGARAMALHLLQVGCRRIAFIQGPVDNFDAGERLSGFMQGMASVPEAMAIQLPGGFDEASGHAAGQAVLGMATRPDAVFAANDMMALGCLFALAQAGVQVPRDIVLAGFDDIPMARFVHPALTTMRVNIAGLGADAMVRLLDEIEGAAGTTGHVPAVAGSLVPELIVRESSARPHLD